MKRLFFYILFYWGIVSLVVSCYKDNGNYEYTTEPDAIEISKEMSINYVSPAYSAFVFKLGETVAIDAKYTINDPELHEDMIAFEWVFGAETISTSSRLELDNCPAGRYFGMLILTDLRYNQKYMSEFNFQVDEAFTDGWALLYEKDGRSDLGYLQIDPNTGEYVYHEDVYSKSNSGKTLAAGVKEMTSHMYDSSPQLFGLSIIQPGEEGPVELDIHNMSPIGYLNREFTSEEKDYGIRNAAYMYGYVAAATEDGSLYIREDQKYTIYVVPHSGIFPSYPVTVDGGLKIGHWINTMGLSCMSNMFFDVMLAYDELNSRCVRIQGLKITPFDETFYGNSVEPHRNDCGWDGYNEYTDIVYPDHYNLSDYDVISMNGGGYDIGTWGTPSLSVIMLLRRKSDGKYFFYTFRYFDVWGSVDVDLDLFFPLPDDIDIDPETMITRNHLGGTDNIFYFTDRGNRNVYYLNAIYGTLNKVYSSSSAITAIGQGEIQNMYAAYGASDYTLYYENFVVATEDGDVKVLKMDDIARASGKPEVLYSFCSSAGAVRHIAYLPNSSLSF
ncbi:MAG: PKD-like family lipoprotein [Bacteroidales bacterium]|nr:PKD-like family lipoprotein [Bacteroidales bacterium]